MSQQDDAVGCVPYYRNILSQVNARTSASREAVRARENEATKLRATRSEIWKNKLVQPITQFKMRWAEGWEEFGAIFGKDKQYQDAVVAFLRLGGMLSELDLIWTGWRQSVEEWFRSEATDWNKRYPKHPPLVRLWPHDADASWLIKWVEGYFTNLKRSPKEGQRIGAWWCSGPKGSPLHMPGWFAAKVEPFVSLGSELALETPPSELWACRLLSLLGMAAKGDLNQADLAKSFAQWPRRSELAEISLMFAAAILPSPDLIQRFVDTTPSVEGKKLALWVCKGAQIDSEDLLFRFATSTESGRVKVGVENEARSRMPPSDGLKHGDAFEWLSWAGRVYTFPPNVRGVIRLLCKAWEKGKPGVALGLLFETCNNTPNSGHLVDLFKSNRKVHDAWKDNLIVLTSGSRDIYTLQMPVGKHGVPKSKVNRKKSKR